MTTEEAIKTIEVAIADVEWNYPLDYSIAFETAIEALEKQIPKKPNETEAYPHRLYCPACYYTIAYNKENIDFIRESFDGYKHCPDCGQAIDWSDTND